MQEDEQQFEWTNLGSEHQSKREESLTDRAQEIQIEPQLTSSFHFWLQIVTVNGYSKK